MPARCIDCSEFVSNENSFCSNCWQKYKFIEDPICKKCGRPFDIEIQSECLGCIKTKPKFDESRSIFKFDENSKKLIHNFKYHDKTLLSKFFSSQICSKFSDIIFESDLVTCVPMHKYRRLFRLYNHSQILSKDVAQRSNKAFLPDLLIKTRHTVSQTSLSKTQRRKNIVGSISVREKYDIKGKKIILVDDVITTNTTVDLCAKLLKRAGASKVSVLSIAKSFV